MPVHGVRVVVVKTSGNYHREEIAVIIRHIVVTLPVQRLYGLSTTESIIPRRDTGRENVRKLIKNLQMEI